VANTVYLGETDGKRLARYHIFHRIHLSTISTPLPPGRVITLCGPDPGDVGCIRDMLRVSPERVLFVENDRAFRSGLKKARLKWPGVETYFGNVEDVLRSTKDTVSVLNADLMGTLKQRDLPLFEAAADHMETGSALNFTFFRGREQEGQGLYGGTLSRCQTPGKSLDWLRFDLFSRTLRGVLGGNINQLILALTYDARSTLKNSRHSPMGAMLFQRDAVANNALGHLNRRIEINSFDVRQRLRMVALSLLSKGYPSEAVASILNLNELSIRAWLAHETRGTYTNKPPTGRRTWLDSDVSRSHSRQSGGKWSSATS
jgi:hypothetical protein